MKYFSQGNQCKGSTNRGTRCKQWTRKSESYCTQHRVPVPKPRDDSPMPLQRPTTPWGGRS